MATRKMLSYHGPNSPPNRNKDINNFVSWFRVQILYIRNHDSMCIYGKYYEVYMKAFTRYVNYIIIF